MTHQIELTDALLDRALSVGDEPIPIDLARQVHRAVAAATEPSPPAARLRGHWSGLLLLVAALLAAAVLTVLAIGATRDAIQPRTLTVEVDRGTDPVELMPVTVRDASGLLIEGETMDRFHQDWLDVLVGEVTPPEGPIDPRNPPIAFANPPGDLTRVVVMFLADGVCDDALDLAIAPDQQGLRVTGSLVASRSECGTTLGPMWFALRFSEPVPAATITGELRRQAGQGPGTSGIRHDIAPVSPAQDTNGSASRGGSIAFAAVVIFDPSVQAKSSRQNTGK